MPTNALNITLPTVGGSRNSWGGLTNSALQVVDDFVGDVSPIGLIHMWPKTTAPTTTHTGIWLICDGSAVSQTTYPDLYSVLSPLQAQLDPSSNAGSGNFRLPDLRGRLPLGYVNNQTANGRSSFTSTSRSAGASDDSETHVLTPSQLPSHSHSATVSSTVSDEDPRTPGSNVNSNASSSVLSGTASLSDSGHTHSGEITNRVSASWSTSQTGLGFNDPYWDGTGYAITLNRAGGYNASSAYYSNMSPSGSGYRQGTLNTVSIASGSANITDSGHTHPLPDLTHKHTVTTTVTNADTGGGQAHNIVGPYFVVNFIILAKVPQVS